MRYLMFRSAITSVSIVSCFLLSLFSMTLLTPVAAHADADTMDFLAPTPTGNTIYDSWTPDNTNYYFCGDGGTILHYDGSTFTEMSTPTQYALNGIHGTANNDIWAVGGNAYSEFTDSTRSVILHYDGNSWSSVTPPSTSFGEYHVFDDVWVQGTTIYAVSETYSSIARKVGSQAWAFIDVGTTTNFGYNGLYGFASNDIYAVGECGMINHWNGTTWTLENEESENLCSSSMMSTVLLYSVWGPDADNVFVTGNSGQLLKRADGGGSWNTLYAGGSWSSDSSKHGLSGSSANEVYLAGLNGDLDYWNGSSMTALGEFLSDNSQYTMVRNGSGNYYRYELRKNFHTRRLHQNSTDHSAAHHIRHAIHPARRNHLGLPVRFARNHPDNPMGWQNDCRTPARRQRDHPHHSLSGTLGKRHLRRRVWAWSRRTVFPLRRNKLDCRHNIPNFHHYLG